MKKIFSISFISISLLMPTFAQGGFTPTEAGVDQAPSCGRFVITFTEKFIRKVGNREKFPAPLVAACDSCLTAPNALLCTNGCSLDNRTIISPLLYHPNTKVGRSIAHAHLPQLNLGGSQGIDNFYGTPICQDYLQPIADACLDISSAGNVMDKTIADLGIKAGNIHAQPIHPDLVRSFDFLQGPEGTEEVHVEMLYLDMVPLWPKWNTPQEAVSANKVRAGFALADYPKTEVLAGKFVEKRNLGEVESLNPPGVDGFPAESFFSMFVEVEVDINLDGTKDFTLFNKEPLIVQGHGLTGFPPRTIYKHNANEWSVHIHDKSDLAAGHIGHLRMAAHGMNYGSNAVSAKWNDWTAYREGNFKSGMRDKELDKFSEPEDGEFKDDMKSFVGSFKQLPVLPIKCKEQELSSIEECEDPLPIPPDEGESPPHPTVCEIMNNCDRPDLVELHSVISLVQGEKVLVVWNTASEIDNAGFHLWRARKSKDGEQVTYVLPDQTSVTEVQRLTNKDTFISSQGTLLWHSYVYTDSFWLIPGETYYYALESIDDAGKSEIHLNKIVSVTIPLP